MGPSSLAKARDSQAPGAKGQAHAHIMPRWLRHALRGVLQVALDAGAVLGAYRAAYEIRFHAGLWLRFFPIEGHDPGWGIFTRILYALVPLWIAIFWYSGELYTKPWMRTADRFLLILKGAALGAFATLGATFIYGRLEYSRQMLLLAVPLVVVLVTLSESFVLWLDAWIAQFESTSPMLVVGGGKVAELLRDNLTERHPGMVIHEIPKIADIEDAMRLIQERGISDVVMVRPATGLEKILEFAEACETAGVAVRMPPDLLELRLGEIQMDDSLGIPAYRVQHTSLSPANHIVKRVFDLTIASAVLIVVAVPWALAALLIKLDSRGPVLYKQKRLGYKGNVFEAYKFRTMIADAEKKIETVKTAANDQRGGFFKSKEDPRITRVGRRLRHYSLDEFPQFLNVLLGEMSVVGPRPLALTTGEMEELLREFGPTAKKRLNILPGITGLWQVSGRSDVSSAQRFALDLFYIEHWSLGLDLQIILKTVPAMISGKGAY